MQIPVNCDLYINDCVVDPIDWYNPIEFTNPNIHVIRSYGIHPKTNAPKPFFTRLSTHLVELGSKNTIGGYGPFSIQNIQENPSCKFFEQFINDYWRIKNVGLRPPLIMSSTNDDINKYGEIRMEHTPLLWSNLNNLSADEFNKFCSFKLLKNPCMYFTINGKCLEYKYSNKITSKLKNKQILSRLLLGTDSPHYAANYYGPTYSTPLHIAKMVVEIHEHLIKSNEFKHYRLSDTNDYFTSNAFRIFPKYFFNQSNTHYVKSIIENTISDTINEYKHLVRFLTKTTTTKNIQNDRKKYSMSNLVQNASTSNEVNAEDKSRCEETQNISNTVDIIEPSSKKQKLF